MFVTIKIAVALPCNRLVTISLPLKIILLALIGTLTYFTVRTIRDGIKRERVRFAEEADAPAFFKESETKEGRYLIVDTETTGLPKTMDAGPDDLDNWPRVVEIAWILLDSDCRLVDSRSYVIKQNTPIPPEASKVHGITDEVAAQEGVEPNMAFLEFSKALENCEFLISHNVNFDSPIIEAEFIRNGFGKRIASKRKICTMTEGVDFCRKPKILGEGYKRPNLTELFNKCYRDGDYTQQLQGLHRAYNDVLVAAKCFVKMKALGHIRIVQ